MSSICTIILNLCVIGAVQTGPDTYHLDILDNTGVAVQYTLKPAEQGFKFY